MSSLDQSEDENIYSVENIIKKRTVNNQNQYLIKWVGYDECTWENEDNIIDKEMIEIFEKEKSQKKNKNTKKNEENKIKISGKNKNKNNEKSKELSDTKVSQDNKESVKKQEISLSKQTGINNKIKSGNELKQQSATKNEHEKKTSVNDESKEYTSKKRSLSDNDSVKRTTLDRKINTKAGTNFFNIDVTIVAVEEVYKDKEENTISAKVRYKNGTYAILPMDSVHVVAPLPLIYYYESKMVFSESKDD